MAALYACVSGRPAALRTNYVSVPGWPHSISPLIPMVCHALPRMQRALAGAKRFGVRQLAAALFSCTSNVPRTRSA